MLNSRKVKESLQAHPKGCCFLHPQSCMVTNVGHGIDRAAVLFQVLIKTSKQISIDNSVEGSLKLGNVPSFKVICQPKQAKICSRKQRTKSRVRFPGACAVFYRFSNCGS